MQTNHFAAARRQAVYCVIYTLHIHLHVTALLIRSGAYTKARKRRAVNINNRINTGYTVQKSIAHYAARPLSEVRTTTELIGIAQDFQYRFLQQIFGFVTIPNKISRIIPKFALHT